MKRFKKKKITKEKHSVLGLITVFAIIVSIIGCFTSIVSTQSTISEKEKELADINKKVEAIKIDNAEYQRILDNNDLNAYMEKIAIENMNYAYPNERRFYDTSRN